MVCGNCARENRPDSRFCAGCGTSLSLRCSSCDRELQPDAAFCDGCGTPVAGATPTASPPAPPAEPTAVRKTVTALFCDLVGSTAFGEKVDPEAARESMNRYFAMARTAIEDNGGVVAKFIGDGVMAMWGVPEVAEDDAERAVRAGLDLQEAFTGIRDFIKDRHGVTVGLRVGINTGEVVISDADDDVVGDALNTAARLEAACTPGRVLVGEPTWRLSRGTVHYTDHGVIQAKGKEEPVASYEVVELLDAEDPHTETPFVGRDAELRRLQVVMDEAILERSARLVTVIGSPGVGKTRLAREMREAVEGGTRAFELRCEREGMATFAPVADLLRAAAGITDANSVEEMQERLRTLVDPLEDADRVAELLAGFVGAAPMQSTEELFLAVRRLFEVLGATQPVVLIVDDIQWAEPLFLDLLEHLAEWVRDVPLMVVCLARPEIRDVRPPITEPGRRVSAVVALEGLDTEATHELAARLVGADALPADLLAKIPESTQGNPLFVRELMRMLVDDGVIAERDGRWEMVIDVDAVEVPPTVNTLLASRVERLQTDERQALEFASVVGSDFPVGAVAAAAGDSTGLNATFERLRRKELIEPTGTYWGDEPVFRFHHVLIRDAAYRRLLKGNRAELHVTIGDWTERSAANLVGEHEVTIAHHFEQAHQLRLQLGIDDDETHALGTRAAGLLRTAADRALDREDLAAAGPLAARALACVDDHADGLAELLLTACESLLGTGNVAAGVEAVDRLDSVAGDDRRLRAWVECFRAEVAIYTDPGALQGVIESAGRAADVLAELDDQAGVAKARLQRAAALVRLGRVGDCEAELDAALTAARAADDRRRVTAVLGSAPIAALWGPSPVPRAGGRCLDVVRLLRITTGSPAVEATSIRCQAVLESLRGRHDTARTMLENARSTLEEIGHDHGLMETAYFAGLVELLADDPAAAEPHLRRAHDGLGRLGIGADAGQAAAYLARALLLQDRLDEAEDYALRSDALAGQNPQTAIVSRSVQAEILAARGEFDEALTLAAEAVHLAAGTDILVDHANAVAAQARVRAAAGDAAGAAEAAAAAAALYEEKGATVDVGVTAPAIETTPDVAPAATTDGHTASGADSEPANAATRASRRAVEANLRRDREAWERLTSLEIVVDDRRTGARFTRSGREDVARAIVDSFQDVHSTPSAEYQALDVRGDRLCLHRVAIGLADSVMEWLSVNRIDADERVELSIVFDPDALDEATAELDRLAAELETPNDLETPEWMVTFDLMRVAHEHMTAGRVDDWAAMLSDDFAWVERRPGMQLEAVGRDEARDTLTTILHLPDEEDEAPQPRRADEEPPRVEMTPLDGRGRTLALARVLTFGGGTSRFEREYLLLGRIRAEDDRGDLAMAFDVDDIEAATAELDRLYRQQARDLTPQPDARLSPDNLATAASIAVNAAVRVGSPDLQELVTDGVDLAATPHAFGVTERRPVAVRGENLALFEATLDSGDRAWSVEQYDDDGRLLEWRLFEADRLIDAADHLDERFVALTSTMSEWERVGLDYDRCHRHLDMDGFRRILTDDFIASDHRSFGFPTVDLEDFLAVPSQIEARGVLLTNDLGHRDGAARLTHSVIYDAKAGEPVERMAGITVFRYRDGKIASAEVFAEDDLAGAMARSEELASGVLSIAERMESQINEAAMTSVDAAVDLITALAAPGAAISNRRRGLAHDADPDEAFALLEGVRTALVWESELLASRGARLVATSSRLVYDNDFTVDRCAVIRTDIQGRWELQVAVDTPEEALAVLDELEAEERRSPELRNTATMAYEAAGHPVARIEGADFDLFALIDTGSEPPFAVVEASVAGDLTIERFDAIDEAYARFRILSAEQMATLADVAPLRSFAIAHAAGDTAELERVLAADFAFDGSELAGMFPSMTRSEFIAVSGMNEAFGVDDRVRKTLGIADGAYCALMTQARDDEEDVIDSIILIGWSQGQITAHKVYPPDQLDEALAHFDQLASTRTVAEQAFDWIMAGYAESVAEGMRRQGERVGPNHRFDYRMSGLRATPEPEDARTNGQWLAENATGITAEIVATRGEHLIALSVEWTFEGGFRSPRHVAYQFDADGLIEREVVVDSQADVLAVLDEMAAQRSPISPPLNTAARAAIARDHALFTEPDEAGWLATLAEDVVADERGSLLPRTLHGRAEVRREYREIVQSTTDFVAETTVLAVAGDDVALCRLRVFESDAPRTDAGVFLDLLNLCETNADGLIQRSVTFDAESTDEAQREFARWAEPTSHGSVPHNTAAEVGVRHHRLLFGDLDAATWLALYADDAVIDDRRRLVMRTLEGKEAISAEYGSIARRAAAVGATVESEVIGVRGDDLALCRMRVFEADTPSRDDVDVLYDHLTLCRTDEVGLIAEGVVFDVADEHDAWEELGRRWAESMTPPDRALMLEEVRQARLFQELQFAEWRAGHHPEYTSTDHRPFGFGTTDTEGMAGRNDALTDDVEGGTVRFPVAENIGLGVRVATIEADLVRKTGAQARIELSYVSVADLVNGGGRWNHQFALDDIDDARRRGQEVVDQRRKTIALTEAVAVGGLASGRARHSTERFAEILHEDFQATLLDGRTVNRSAIADGNVPPADVGFGEVERSVVCNDGSIGLFRVETSDRSWVSLEQSSRDRLVGIRQFAVSGVDDLRDAVEAFNQAAQAQYVGTGYEATARATAEHRSGHTDRDLDRLAAVVSDDLVFTDHRPLMHESMDRDHYFEVLRRIEREPKEPLVTEMLRIADGASLMRGHQAVWADGTWDTGVNASLAVGHVVNGRVAAMEMFPLDALDDAEARFEELRDETDPGSNSHSRVPLNTAARAALRNNRALFDQPGEEAWLATFADDVVVDDRQRMARRTLRGKEEIRGDYISVSQRATKFGFDVETEVLGVRDDNFAITLMRVFESDADGRTDTDVFLDHVAIYRTDDDSLIDRCAMFDVADENDAWDELGRWWADTMPAPERLLELEEARRGRLFADFEYDTWRRGHHPTYVSTDHRPFGFGTTDLEGMAERNAALMDDITEGTVRAPTRESLGYGVSLVTLEADLVRKTGADARVELSAVAAVDLVNGGVIRNDQFALAEVSDARALGIELVEERRRGIALTEAVAVGGVASGRARESLDLFAETLRDDFQATLLDGTTRSAADVVSGNVDPATLGFGHVDRSVLCNINQVGLFVVRSDDGEWFSLEVCSDDQLISVHLLPIDDPRTALRAFDDAWPTQYAGTELHDTALTGTRFRQAMAARDRVALDALLAENFVVSDKRNLMYGDLERGAYLEAIGELSALPNPEVVGEALGLSANCWIWRGRQLIPEEGFGSATNAGVFVIGFAAGRITRLEAFDEDDLDVAIARFEELTAAPVARSFAEAVGFEWIDRARRGDVAGVMALHPDGGMEISEDTWGSEFDMDEADYQQVLETVLRDVRRLEPSPIDYRGPRFTAGHVALETSSAEMNWITVAECLPDGRFNRLRMLGSATEAVATLDRWLEDEQRSLELRNSATIFFEHAGHVGEVVAVALDHLAIVRPETGYAVIEVDDFGALEIVRFPTFTEASTAMRSRRADARPSTPGATAAATFGAAIRSHDRDQLDAAIAERYVVDIHGDLDVMPRERSAFIDYVATGSGAGVEETTPKIFAVSEAGVCVLSRVSDASGTTEIDRVNVLVGDEAGITYNGVWPVEMLDDALAKFDELSAETADSTVDIRDVSASIEAALSAGDLDAFAAHFADDLDFRNESVLSDAGGGKQQMLENIASQGDYTWSGELIVSVGRASVFRLTADLPGDNELQWCLFATVNDEGLIDRWHVREVEHLRFAFIDAMLSLGDIPGLDMMAAFNAGDETALAATVADEFVFHDHRTSSVLGDLDATEWLRLQAESMRLFPASAHWVEIIDHTNDVAMGTIIRWSDPGGPSDWRFITVQAHREGRATSIDIFGPQEVDRARARFDELALTPNRSAELSFHRTALLQTRDEEAFKALLHPDYTSRSHRSLGRPDVGSRDEYMDMLGTFAPVGFPAPHQVDLIATRGDKLALLGTKMATDDGWTTDFLVLHQIDDDGLLRLSTVWDADQLDAATAELDRLWAEEQAGG